MNTLREAYGGYYAQAPTVDEDFEDENFSHLNPEAQDSTKKVIQSKKAVHSKSNIPKKYVMIIVVTILIFSFTVFSKKSVDQPKTTYNLVSVNEQQPISTLKIQEQFKKQEPKKVQQQIMQISTSKVTSTSKQEIQKKIASEKAFVSSQDDKVDKYFLDLPIQILVKRSTQQFAKNRIKAGIRDQQFEIAVRLLEVPHNINIKGETEVQLSEYDDSLKEIKQMRIRNILQRQNSYYEQHHEISKYQNQHPFCVVAYSYNDFENALYLRNLDSIFMQDYSNYHVVYINDASTEQGARVMIEQYTYKKRIDDDKMQIVQNEQRLGFTESIYHAIHQKCKSGQIVVLVDGDDALIGRKVFKVLNSVYQNTGPALVYSRGLNIYNNQKISLSLNSKEIPKNVLLEGGIRKLKTLFTSNLLTFYSDLFKNIERGDLQDKQGKFYKSQNQLIISTPLLQLAGERVKMVNDLLYQNRLDSQRYGIKHDQMWLNELEDDPYEAMESFAFIPYQYKQQQY